jgi:hypothetical protein
MTVFQDVQRERDGKRPGEMERGAERWREMERGAERWRFKQGTWGFS